MWNNVQSMDTGGGYLNSPGYGSSQPSSQSTQRRIQNIMPCTIAMIVNAETVNDNAVYQGITLNQITFIGIVKSTRVGNPYTAYDIYDMSGPVLEVRQFLDSENEPRDDMTSAIRENIYVRVFGNVRTFQGKRSVVAFKVRPLLDMNELTSHLLETLYAKVSLKKKFAATQAENTLRVANYVPPPGFGSSSTATSTFTNTSHMSNAVNNSGMTDMQQKILNIFKACGQDAGVSVQTIGLQLMGVPIRTVRETVDFLASEGHIFSTIDDDHYRAIDADF